MGNVACSLEAMAVEVYEGEKGVGAGGMPGASVAVDAADGDRRGGEKRGGE